MMNSIPNKKTNQMDLEEQLEKFKTNLVEEFNLQQIEETQTGLSPERIGRFTGSGLKKLMTCKSRKKGLDWSMREKLVDFGDTAINYCLEKAIERMTGKTQYTPATWQMRWGTEHEPIAREKLFEKNGIPYPEQEFMFFLRNAGCTPDSFIDGRNVEIKCPPTPDNHHKYITQDMDESHEYFWQIQGEMMAQSKHRNIECNETIFVSYNPDFPEGFQLGERIVKASVLHQKALIVRCIIGEMMINKIMNDFWKRPSDHLNECIAGIPNDPKEIDIWLNHAIILVSL